MAIAKQYFIFTVLMLLIQGSFCADRGLARAKNLTNEYWTEEINGYYFAYIPSIVSILKQKRSDASVLAARDENPISKSIEKIITNNDQIEAVSEFSGDQHIYSACSSFPVNYYRRYNKTTGLNKSYHIATASGVPWEVCRRSADGAYQLVRNPRGNNAWCLMLCKAIKHGVAGVSVYQLMRNTPNALHLSRDFGSAHRFLYHTYYDTKNDHYSCSPLHISALRFAYAPTRESKSIITILLKSGGSLCSLDSTENAQSSRTPLELLTDDELKKLSCDEFDYIEAAHCTLSKLLPREVVENIINYVVGYPLGGENYSKIIDNKIHY